MYRTDTDSSSEEECNMWRAVTHADSRLNAEAEEFCPRRASLTEWPEMALENRGAHWRGTGGGETCGRGRDWSVSWWTWECTEWCWDMEGQTKEGQIAPAYLHIWPARTTNFSPDEHLQCHCDQPFGNQLWPLGWITISVSFSGWADIEGSIEFHNLI